MSIVARLRNHPATARVVTGLAALLVLFGLLVPNQLTDLTPAAFLRIPIEALLVVGLMFGLPVKARRPVAVGLGVLLGVVTIIKILDMGFFAAFDRPFDPMIDYAFFPPAVEVVNRSFGRVASIAAVVGAIGLALGLLILMPLAVLRLTRLMTPHRLVAVRSIAGLGVVWVLCAVFGLQLVPDLPLADRNASATVFSQITQVRSDLKDKDAFAREQAVDRFAAVPSDQLLNGLRGKNVIFAFVESYGRVAVQDSAFSPAVNAVLDNGTNQLRAAGFSARTAFLTSPTYGGASWLAHSTLQSGLWIDSQQRYGGMTATPRLTLTGAFQRAGWRTVGVMPANDFDWPQAPFYGFGKIWDTRDMGYRGPGFNLNSMPDQYTLSAFQRSELAAANHPPVMAEIDLLSGHAPWAPLPRMVAWSDVGDGSVYNGMPAQGLKADDVWRDPKQIRAEYGHSIEYSLSSLISYVQTYGDRNTMLIILGDHQPAPVITGEKASRDVPISVVAADPAVLDRISGWGWTAGLRPDPQSPVWRMDDFRDRFLAAYS